MKKIINTIKGVLVRWYWNIHDEIVTIYKVLQFRFHFIENYKESLEFDEKELQFRKEKENLKKVIDKKDDDINKLKEEKLKTQNKLIEKERILREYTSVFPDDLHKYLNMQVEYEELKKQIKLTLEEKDNFEKIIKKLEYDLKNKNENIIKLKLEVSELNKQVKELNKQLDNARKRLVESDNKNKFLESKLPKKTLEEIVAYTFSQKEVLKRSKKNDRQD